MARWVCPWFCVHSDCSIDFTVPRWSYGINLTFIGNAVYTSMDVPDFFLAIVKLLNYIRWERAQIVAYIVFMGTWT